MGSYIYRYSKWEGLNIPEKKQPRTRRKNVKWDSLSASDRWKLMSLEQISAECSRLHISYGKAQTMMMQGTLPEDFGKDVENNG